MGLLIEFVHFSRKSQRCLTASHEKIGEQISTQTDFVLSTSDVTAIT